MSTTPKLAQEFWLCKNPIDTVCTDMHVYDNKPIWFPEDGIHVREILEPTTSASVEELAEAYAKKEIRRMGSFHVAEHCNDDVLASAFEAGYEAAKNGK